MVTMLSDPRLLPAMQATPPRAEALPAGWLALRQCRLGGTTLPLILLHPAQGVAIIGGPPEGPALLRDRLAVARFGAIFPGTLPAPRLDHAADPAPAFAALPPLALPGGDAWVGVVRRALESVPDAAPPVARRSWARRRRLRRRLGVAAGVAGLAMAACLAWIATLPPAPMGAAGMALSGGVPWDIAGSPAGADAGILQSEAPPGEPPAGSGLAAAPVGQALAGIAPPPDMPAAAPLPSAAAGVAPAPPLRVPPPRPPAATALPDPPVVVALPVPPPAVAAPAPPILAAPPAVATATAFAAATGRPPQEAPRADASGPAPAHLADAAPHPVRPARRDPPPDLPIIRPAAASVGLPGRCRSIIQRLQIGDFVADGDIRLLQRGCPG